MEKINMKTVVVALLKSVTEIKKVATDYPTTWNTFPTAIYRTSSKPNFVDYNGEELQTQWNVTIELYGNGSLTDIVTQIMNAFGDIGFFGTFKDANTADLTRVIVELSAIVDNKTKYVYSK